MFANNLNLVVGNMIHYLLGLTELCCVLAGFEADLVLSIRKGIEEDCFASKIQLID
jgi:hypothetical protein